jgi:hypothetical protein
MIGDDAFAFLVALTGDVDLASKFDADNMHRSDVVDLIEKLREERDHLRNQLEAAREHANVMSRKRQYSLTLDSWLRNDLGTLRRLLAEA